MSALKKSFLLGILSCLFFTLAYALPQSTNEDVAFQSSLNANTENMSAVLQTAARLVHERHLDQANDMLNHMPLVELTNDLKNQHTLLSARIALLQHDSDAVLHLLERIEKPDSLSQADAITYHLLSAHAYVGNHKYLASIRERVTLQALIKDEKNQQQNYERLWQTLNMLGHAPNDLIEQESIEVATWLQLANLAREAGNDATVESALTAWKARHPNHPGLQFVAHPNRENKAENAPQTNNSEQLKVALLLPLSGPLAEAGKAVQNGFLAAQASEPKAKPAIIKVYDSNQAASMTALYEQAVREGAQFIIGPMQKNAVIQLGKRGHFEVPTLALNYAAVDPQPNFFQFGLSPQDEAAQVAKRAFADGKRAALIIAPKDDWGQGIVDSFLTEWQALGGRVVGSANYAKTDMMDQQIKRLLDIDKSQARRKELQLVLGTKINSDASHRQDSDMLFVVGSPSIARQIRPLLKFYYAGKLPVYSSSMIYSGVQNAQDDRDIDGVRFCDMPWILQASQFQNNKMQLAKLVPRGTSKNTRLYAIGMDSYALISQLKNPGQFPADGLFAASGRLFLNPNQQISRQLLWATFQNGAPKLIM